MKGYFITSTDTDVGKTTASLCLMRHFKQTGKKVACMKPVSAGCYPTENGLRNDDAEQLINESSIEVPYELVNPYAFEPSIAPHIAAQQLEINIDKEKIKSCYSRISVMSDVIIVEGAGGWLVPISNTESMADIAVSLQLPVILVVGMRLGCLNHALLTASSIQQYGIQLAGWIANYIDKNMLQQEENLETLKKLIAAPLIGEISYNNNPQERILNIIDNSVLQ